MSTSQKLERVKKDALSAYELDLDFKKTQIQVQRMKCSLDNKTFYQIPKSGRPLNVEKLKSRRETIHTAMYGLEDREYQPGYFR